MSGYASIQLQAKSEAEISSTGWHIDHELQFIVHAKFNH